MKLILAVLTSALICGQAQDYAIVVSTRTETNVGWREAVTALRQRHSATVVTYQVSVEEVLPALRKLFPRYACFVVQPTEVSREFVARVHRLTRRLNDDPYPDCFWGILTGYDAANALRIARCSGPLTIHKVASGTPIPLEYFDEGRWYSELDPGRHDEEGIGRSIAGNAGGVGYDRGPGESR